MRAALVCFAILGAACSQPRPAVLYGPSDPLSADDYEEVLKTWTRDERVYQGLENKLFFTATYHSPEFRRAFALAFPDIYGHGGDVTRRELVDLTGNVEQFHTFFVVAYTPDEKWNDFERVDSIWRIQMINDNRIAVQPHEIATVKIDENLRAVYPHIGRFDQAYLVRFPLTDALGNLLVEPHSTSFSLRVASALGVGSPAWKLKVPTGLAPEPEVPSSEGRGTGKIRREPTPAGPG